MDKLEWTPVFDVHNTLMNDEHKTLIALMDNLRDRNQRSMDKQGLLETFEKLIAFTKVHFSDEEKHMNSIHYPKAEQHKLIHQQLLNTLESQAEEFRRSVSGKIPTAVFDFFKTWLVSHILMFDKDYAKHETENSGGIQNKNPT